MAANDAAGKNQGHLAGPAVQRPDQFLVFRPVGDGELRPEGVVDHLHHLQRDARDGAGRGEDRDIDGPQCVADRHEGALQVEGIADGKTHKGEGRWGKAAYLAELGVLQPKRIHGMSLRTKKPRVNVPTALAAAKTIAVVRGP